MENLIEKIRIELKANSNEKIKASSQRFFKHQIKNYGVRNPVVNKISKDIYKLIYPKTKFEIFELCEHLFQSTYIEESLIACHWSFRVNKFYTTEDVHIFEKWINNYVNNWAICDTLCNHSVGTFIERFPEYTIWLKKLAKSENLWMRRAAAVSLIVPARKGLFLTDILEIADILLLDKEDMVQKGYGWMLKVASETNQQAIFDYIIRNKAVMPRTALRYAIEKMPEKLKKQAMKK